MIYLIDSGHGGMIAGKYQIAPDKMFTHQDGSIFYEGVFNRTIKKMLFKELKNEGIMFIDICPSDLDLSLDYRIKVVNECQADYPDCLLISLHSNAGGGTGIEIFAHHNSSTSQHYGNLLSEFLIAAFPGVKFRKGQDQLCKTANFQILRETICPAILPEFMFFDNFDDYQKLIDWEFQVRYVRALVEFIKKCESL